MSCRLSKFWKRIGREDRERSGGQRVGFDQRRGPREIVGHVAVRGERRNFLTALRTLVETPRFNALRLTMQSRAVIGIDLGVVWDRKGTLVELAEPLGDLMRGGSIKPVVAESFALARGADAHRFIQGRRNVGKVVLAI